jgi:hypothetical protein
MKSGGQVPSIMIEQSAQMNS